MEPTSRCSSPARPTRYDVLARTELAPVTRRLLFAWKRGCPAAPSTASSHACSFVDAAGTGEQLVFGVWEGEIVGLGRMWSPDDFPKPALSVDGLLLRAWDHDDAQVVLAAGGDDE